MKIAIGEASKAFQADEVPVGAIITNSNGQIIAQNHNLKEGPQNPCGHAELIVIQEAAKTLKSWRLTGCKLYVTLEPCMMCAGAIVQSRIESICFGAYDPKGGFVESLAKGFKYQHNHKPSWTGGVMELECSTLLKDFFKTKRKD